MRSRPLLYSAREIVTVPAVAEPLTVSVAVRDVPLAEAVMTAVLVDEATDVVIVKVVLVAPPGTVTLAGTLAAAGSPLDSETTRPPVGAAADSVTVPVEVEPPVTVAGLSESEAGVGAEGGGDEPFTVNVAVCVTPPALAVISATRLVDPATLETGNDALDEPSGTVTEPGTVAAPVLLLASATGKPPAGAGPVSSTVPVDPWPAVTVLGLSDTPESEAGGGWLGACVIVSAASREEFVVPTAIHAIWSRPWIGCVPTAKLALV
jgi:hypothetical protein